MRAYGQGSGKLRTRAAICSLFFVTLLVSSSAGCLSLVTTRELLESMRDEPVADSMTQKYSLNNTFTSLSPNPYFGSDEIIINETVSEIRIYFRASMAFADQTENLPLDSVRYVNARLIQADGTEFWSINATNTTRPPELREFQPFTALGTWTLEVDARGYGADVVIQEFYDEFLVQVTVVRECTKYPAEDKCSFD